MSSAINIHDVLLCGLILCGLVTLIRGHGRLVEPPSRSSMWRFGFKTPVNYNDNQLYCGGYDVQWKQNGGRCGVCGDPFNGVRENEAGGRYATGTIARHYSEGQTITVTIDVTTNHGGYFEFRICPTNNLRNPATEACLNQNLLRQPNGQTKWYLPEGTRTFSLNLVLPRSLTCSQCVLQWKWNTASNWDCDVNNNCCKGCGPQEQFLGCADVAIGSNNDIQTQVNAISAQRLPLGSIQPDVKPSNNVLSNTGPNGFIPVNAASVPSGFIPAPSNIGGRSDVKCESTAIGKMRFAYADRWCMTQCAIRNCPLQYCQDGCRSLYQIA